MKRPLNLRQVEAFKAVVEAGTVSRAAEVLLVSQPAVSKLLAHLEADTGLQLFDRVRGRLAPSKQGMRFYEEVSRIFAGIRQVERAADVIRREEQGRLVVGVLPALSTSFIQRATAAFMRRRPRVYVSILGHSSQFIVDWLSTRQIDVGLISSRPENPYIETEPMMRHPLVCIMPRDHPLTARRVVVPADLHGTRFISFAPLSPTRRPIEALLEGHGVQPDTVLDATTAPAVSAFVADGLGVSLVHPVFAAGVRDRIAMRPFEPEIPFEFQLCRTRDSRNADLVEAFVAEARATAAAMARELLSAG